MNREGNSNNNGNGRGNGNLGGLESAFGSVAISNEAARRLQNARLAEEARQAALATTLASAAAASAVAPPVRRTAKGLLATKPSGTHLRQLTKRRRRGIPPFGKRAARRNPKYTKKILTRQQKRNAERVLRMLKHGK
jgi:hypothetical protein